MANLFAVGSLETVTIKENKKIEFKGTYAIDFETGEFIRNPDGSIKVLDEFEGYIQWCEKVMLTARYKYKAYSSRYGKDIIGSFKDEKAMELEIKRITQEALMVHPMTESVDDFSFNWMNGEVYYEYEVKTTAGQKKVLTSKEKVG
jgi:hypothetical protein